MLAAVVCPHPPLLVPEVAAGAAGELDDLRAACDEALKAGLAAGPDRVVIVGVGPPSRGSASTWPVQAWPADTAGALPGFGLPGVPGELPLSLTVGRWLLERAGWDGPRELFSIAPSATAAECRELGKLLGEYDPPAVLLVMGDGTARRSAAAPGHFDPRAEAFDATVAAALAAADTSALAGLDPGLADELLVAGRTPWQVLASAARAAAGITEPPWAATLHYDAAPYGVGYLVATWLRPA